MSSALASASVSQSKKLPPEITNIEIILSVAIFSHGCESEHGLEKNDPWTEKHNIHQLPGEEINTIKNFYKNNVRVFSQARVPDKISLVVERDVPGIVSYYSELMEMNPTFETKALFTSTMDMLRPEYQTMLKPECINPTTSITSRLTSSMKQKYKKKTCSSMVFLADKIFQFSYKSDGIYVIDIRIKYTHSNGDVSYRSIFVPKKSHPVNLITQKGMHFFINKLVASISQVRRRISATDTAFELNDANALDLIELYRIFKLFDFVNILDFSCRSMPTKKATGAPQKITGRRISYMYDSEKTAEEEMINFGGKYKKKTQRKNKRVRKTVKSI
jgi:hypothetical protein